MEYAERAALKEPVLERQMFLADKRDHLSTCLNGQLIWGSFSTYLV